MVSIFFGACAVPGVGVGAVGGGCVGVGAGAGARSRAGDRAFTLRKVILSRSEGTFSQRLQRAGNLDLRFSH